MPHYENRNALILGAGKSGLAAARLILALNGRASIVDRSWNPRRRTEIGSEGITCLNATDTLPDGAYDLLIVSPSIPMDHPWLKIARTRGLAIISEMELAGRCWKGDILALTGSKGKSSAVKCLADTLNLSGKSAVTAGNFGTPLSERVLQYPNRGRGIIAVTEVSSFQMEHTRTFDPRLAAILNIQSDHLDRHASMAEYENLKRKIFQAQRPNTDATAFLPEGFSPEGIPSGVPLETFGTAAMSDWTYRPGAVTHGQTSITVAGVFDNPILGPTAALIVAMLTHSGLTPEQIAAGFAAYKPLPHRMQTLGSLNGAIWVDDSKATSLTATEAALRMLPGPGKARLIAGGLLKEKNLVFLKETLCNQAAAVYLIGDCAHRLYDAWHDAVPCHLCDTLDRAANRAFREAQPGETILLSPGCASFDQFEGMAARGEAFRTCFEHAATSETSA